MGKRTSRIAPQGAAPEPPAPDHSPPPATEAWVQAVANALWLGLVGASLGYLCAFLTLDFSHVDLVLHNAIPATTRQSFFGLVVGAGLAGALAAAALCLGTLWASNPSAAREELSRRLRGLRPLALIWLLPPALDRQLWVQMPLLLPLLAFGALLLVASRLGEGPALGSGRHALPAAAAWVLLVTAMAGYAAYATSYTIQHHHQLGTSAYDLGIMENVFWNTTHGRFFASSIEGGSHLGVHTSFIYILFLPLYGLAPRPETLLILQAVVFALAAWPLFLIGRELLGSQASGLVVAVLYLIHPAVGGANFYDFHELAFAPPLFFAAFYFWLVRRSRLLWAAVVLLLMVKEDLSLVVALLGLYSLVSRRYREGLALALTGAASYVLLQHVVIPHFANGPHDYTWYYTAMIPPGEGPLGLVRTLVVNPLFSLTQALSVKKLTYLSQILAPLAFLSLVRSRGLLLMAYGLFMAVFASREPVYSLGFQYALLLVPPAFVASVVNAAELRASARRRVWLVAVAMSLLVCYHHGMFWPRHNFIGGFGRIDFTLSEAQRQRSTEVERVAAKLPLASSVTASETVVPHLARRPQVQTLRYADSGPARRYDLYVVLRDELDPATWARFPEVFDQRDYQLAFEGQFILVYARRGLAWSLGRA